jgi:hypothetical protein
MLAFAALLLLAIEATSSAAHADGTISACGPVTVPGTYTVTKDITAPPYTTNTNCITIMASGVAIDLKGHTIHGSGASIFPYNGIIAVAGSTNITNIIVANGTIKGFSTNLNFGFVSGGVTISNVKAVNGGLGIDVGGDYAVVTDSEASNNVGVAGISFSRGNNNTVLRTIANNNGGDGIIFHGDFLSGNNNTVVDSQANGNASGGCYSQVLILLIRCPTARPTVTAVTE